MMLSVYKLTRQNKEKMHKNKKCLKNINFKKHIVTNLKHNQIKPKTLTCIYLQSRCELSKMGMDNKSTKDKKMSKNQILPNVIKEFGFS